MYVCVCEAEGCVVECHIHAHTHTHIYIFIYTYTQTHARTDGVALGLVARGGDHGAAHLRVFVAPLLEMWQVDGYI